MIPRRLDGLMASLEFVEGFQLASREVKEILIDFRQLVGDEIHLSRDTPLLALRTEGMRMTFQTASVHE